MAITMVKVFFKIALILSSVVAVVVLWVFYSSYYPLIRAKRIIRTHSSEILAEAQAISSGLSPNEVLFEESMTNVIRSLNPIYVGENNRINSGAIQIMLTGGFHHSGIVVVTNHELFQESDIPFEVEKLHQSIYVFKE